jgi:Transglycosylase SLT domain
MADNILESYLVKLGATVDTSSVSKFSSTISSMTNQVSSMTTGIVRDFVKIEGAIVGTFASVGLGIIGLADKTAMADQQYRLFGLRMLMGKDAARAMQLATDNLGASLDQIAYDPELNARFRDLYDRNMKLSQSLGMGFDSNMKMIRGIRTEVKQFGTELTFLTMGTVSSLFEKLGLGSGDLLHDVRALNMEFGQNLPMWIDKVTTFLVPVWGDFRRVMGGVKDDAEAVGLSFTNLVGILSGDQSIQGATFNLDKLATALLKVAGALTSVATTGEAIIAKTAGTASAVGSFAAYQIDMLKKGTFQQKADDARSKGEKYSADWYQMQADDMQKKADQDWNNYIASAGRVTGGKPLFGKNIGSVGLGGGSQGLTGIPFSGFRGMGTGLPGIDWPSSGMSAPSSGTFRTGSMSDIGKTVGGDKLSTWLSAAHQRFPDVPASLLAATAWIESQGDPNAIGPMTKGGWQAKGMMQFSPDTAKKYGIDPMNPEQSIVAAAHYYHDLLTGAAGGDISKAEAYYSGNNGNVDAAQDYIGKISQEQAAITISTLNIVLPLGTPQEHAQAMVDQLRQMNKSNTQRLTAQVGAGAYAPGH